MTRQRTSSFSNQVNYYARFLHNVILQRQNPITGLFTTFEDSPDAWVRDNVNVVLSVWALSIVQRKSSESEVDRAKAYELEQCVVRAMRGVLRCFMIQQHKLEKFKKTQSPKDSLHAKYDSRNCEPIVADDKWGHLQIDAISLYLVILAEITTSGLHIVQTIDEVTFIQNLIFYIEAAYRIPDYGVWERGDKTNHGLPELNSSSVGMAHAALKSLDGLNLFGAEGGYSSVIHTLPDETSFCHAVLLSMLPRESLSKEIDSALLSIIGYPAFAVDEPKLIKATNEEIMENLEGRYGFKRFLRDGYKTAVEDEKRLHYEPHELKAFEDIECEWPLFMVTVALNALFGGANSVNPDDPNAPHNILAREYIEKVESVMVLKNGFKVIPELYFVEVDKIKAERDVHGSQERKPGGKIPHMWAQSLYVIAKLVADRLLSPGEIDPLNRRMACHRPQGTVTQIVLLAEDEEIKERVASHGITCQTIAEVAPIRVHNARVLSYIYSHLGKNKRLGLSGRASTEIGVLATSKLYLLHDEIFAFTPGFLDQHVYYLGQDTEYLIDMFTATIAFLNRNWTMLGRPTMVVTLNRRLMGHDEALQESMIAALRNLQSGIISGLRVHLGHLEDFISTSCVSRLSFLEHSDDFSDKGLQRFIVQNSGKILENKLGKVRFKVEEYGSPFAKTKERLSKTKSNTASKLSGVISRRRQSLYPYPGQLAAPPSPRSPGSGPSSAPESPGRKESLPMSLEEFIARVEHDKHTHLSPSQTHLARPSSGNIDPANVHQSHRRPRLALSNKHDDEMSSFDINEIVGTLEESTDLYEQADLVHGLFLSKGLKWVTPLGCSVEDLIAELAESAAELRAWWLVRHANGVLRRHPEDLAKCLIELLVRGKQVSFGLPPNREVLITGPMSPKELENLIWNASDKDPSLTALTQELLVALSMIAKSEKRLFKQMIRVRLGLISQVMASELASMLSCSPEEATSELMNLSPYQVKILLYRVISGSELAPKYRSMDSRSMSVGKLITSRTSKRSFTKQSKSLASAMATVGFHSQVLFCQTLRFVLDHTIDTHFCRKKSVYL